MTEQSIASALAKANTEGVAIAAMRLGDYSHARAQNLIATFESRPEDALAWERTARYTLHLLSADLAELLGKP